MNRILKKKMAIKCLLLTSIFQSAFAAEETRDHFPSESVVQHKYNLIPSQLSENLSWAIEQSVKHQAPLDPSAIPSQYDLSTHVSYIHNQGSLGSCTGQAFTLSMEIILKANNGTAPALSSLFVYYNERVLGGNVKNDDGASLSDGIRAIRSWGACRDVTWSYTDNKTKFKERPPQAAYDEGRQFLCLNDLVHSHVQHDLLAIKSVLAKNIPIVFGIYIYPSFNTDRVIKTGEIPIPLDHEKPLGGHAMVMLGFDDKSEKFKIANSWGETWGDKGFGYLPYQYVMNQGPSGSRAFFFEKDLWAVSQVGQDTSGSDDTGLRSPL